MSFEAGDVVKAKIVGEGQTPELTVEWSDYSGQTGVVWFDKELHLQRATFSEGLLEYADPKKRKK